MGVFDFLFKKKPKLTEKDLQWNKMWELWAKGYAESPYSELMTYQSEVNNGGHAQYFDNVSNTSDLQSEMRLLKTILPQKLNEILETAYAANLSLEKQDDEQAEEILNQCDTMFYEEEEKINQLLKEYACKIKL